jgi:hypothetical protein
MSEINEELISAYLDHELSKVERELVEAALAHDPKLRQLKDELEMLHEDFELLPVYYALDIQQTISKAANQPTVRTKPKISANPISNPSNKNGWLAAGVGLAACLLLTVTLMNKPADTEPLAMSDGVSSPPAEMEAPLTESLTLPALEMDDGSDMEGLAPQQAAKMQDKVSAEANSGQRNYRARIPAEGQLSGLPQNKFDQTIRISVAQNQLTQLLATIEPSAKKIPVENAGLQGFSPSLKSIPANSGNRSKTDSVQKFDNGSADLVYAIQRTPEELVSLMTQLQNSNYLPSSVNAARYEDTNAKDRYPEQVKNKENGKLHVLFLITIEPDLESESK